MRCTSADAGIRDAAAGGKRKCEKRTLPLVSPGGVRYNGRKRGTIHDALHPAARHPASKITVACIQPLAVRRLFNGLDALQFAAGWAVNCNEKGAEMEEQKKLFDKYMTEELVQMVLSNPRSSQAAARIQIRPVQLKGGLVFQASEYKDKKVFHHNLERGEAIRRLTEWMEQYKQLVITHSRGQAHVLVSKKGKVTVKEKDICCVKQVDLSHNRKKQYILQPDRRVDFLVDLGVQTSEGKIIHSRYDKFRQINRFLEFIEDILPQLPRDREIHILDFGCGKSYLTFAIYYYLRELKGLPVAITGLDLKEDVMEHCNQLARKYGYEKLHFYVGNIAQYEGEGQVDMVVTLHACDTATDYALDKAIRWGARVILSVPCCQHELNGQMKNELLEPIFQYGLIRERMAALFTDALRAQILESRGYEVQLLEFIDMEHTPKNILIRAVKGKGSGNEGRYQRVMDFLQVTPTLARLQQEEGKKQG